MQATELCAYLLSIDEPWQVKGVDVNEGGCVWISILAFALSPEHGSAARTSRCAPRAMRNLRSQKPPRPRSGVIPILAAIDLRQRSNPARVAL